MRGGEIRVRATLHPSGYWIALPVTVMDVAELLMVLDTGSPVSAISPPVRDALLTSGLITPASDGARYLMTRLTVHDQPLPDLVVRVLSRLERIRVNGLLGLDFLRQFEYVHFHVPSLQLVLQRPRSS